MDMNVGKHAHRKKAVCFLVLLLSFILPLPVCTATINDPLVLPQDLQEAIVTDSWKKGDLGKTQSLLDSALAAYPESAVLWDIQAGVELKKGNYEKAVEAGKRALKIASTPGRHTNLGWMYQHMEQYTRAVMHYKMGLSGVNEWKENYFYLAECLEKTGRQNEAVKYYRRYIDAFPDGLKRNDAEKRLALIQGTSASGETADMSPATSGGLAYLTPEQKRRSDAICGKKYPGLVAVDYDPKTKNVTCGCPGGGINIGEGCLSRLELEIIRAVNRKDIDRAKQLAAQVEPGTTFYSNVLEDVRYLAKIKRETPWMLKEETFRQEMERRDAEFQNAMQEYDRQSRQNDALWGQLVQTTLETQMKAICNAVSGMDATPGTEAFVPGNTHPADSHGGLSKIEFSNNDDDEEMTDRLVLMNTPVPDNLDPGDYDWVPPLNVDQDEIVGVWRCEFYKINVMKNGERRYVAKVLETYPVKRSDGKGLTRYPFGPGEICCKVGEGSGGGGPGAFLRYSGRGWVWDGTKKKWDWQDLVMESDEDGFYLHMSNKTEDGGHFLHGNMYRMRKVQ